MDTELAIGLRSGRLSLTQRNFENVDVRACISVLFLTGRESVSLGDDLSILYEYFKVFWLKRIGNSCFLKNIKEKIRFIFCRDSDFKQTVSCHDNKKIMENSKSCWSICKYTTLMASLT